ncbi:phospho-sugar mutase [bacterium]|nr:phospho-sugar mutase [bacterium]
MTNLEKWQLQGKKDPEILKEIKKLSKDELLDAFSTDLTFGTGGMRGVMGVGTNRMNIYTLRKANYGLGKYLVNRYKEEISRGVVISHDNRLNSRNFAIESAKVLASFGIKCFMFDDLRTTPELSFSVRYLKAIAGIMITASHNPSKYNGYKIYDEDGCQYTIDAADKVIEEVNKVEDIFEIPVMDFEMMESMGLYKILSKDVDDAFASAAESVELFKDLERKIKVVYTPLHGTGADMAKRVLLERGYDAYFVDAQMEHDPYFKSVALPNPEDPNAFKLAEELGRKVGADLLVATDPDADRVGIGVLHEGKYHYLTGNQTGALLLYFRLSKEKELGILPKKGKVFNTIVTSELGASIAKSFGFQVFSTLTGFKFIGEQAKLLEGTDTNFIFGYEESYGYIIKDYVRDKDSIQSLIAICEMANYYHIKENKTLVTVLNEVYEKYGYYKEYTRNMFFEGADGPKKMAKITDYFRTSSISKLGGVDILVKEDYLESKRIQLQSQLQTAITLPKSDVIKYILDNYTWAVIRPSGTEPKLKVYYSAKASSIHEAEELIERIDGEVLSIIDKVSNA